MIHSKSVYKSRRTGEYVRTAMIHDDLIECRPLTRDLNVQSAYVQEIGAPVRHVPRSTFESGWEFLKELT